MSNDDGSEPPDEEDNDEDTLREPIACVGEYPDIPAYLRGVLEPLMEPTVAWVLDHVDWDAVLARFEGNRYRYFWEGGRVFRMG